MVVVGVRVRWAGRATGAAYLYVSGEGGWHGDHVIRLLTGFRRRTARVAELQATATALLPPPRPFLSEFCCQLERIFPAHSSAVSF